MTRRRSLPETAAQRRTKSASNQSLPPAGFNGSGDEKRLVLTARRRRFVWVRSQPQPCRLERESKRERDRSGREKTGERERREKVAERRERELRALWLGHVFFYRFIAFGERRKCPSSSRPRIETCRPSTNSFRRAGRNGATRFAKFRPENKVTKMPL